MLIKLLFNYSVDERYDELLKLAASRRQKLQDALSLHQLNREANVVESWIDEKVIHANLFLIEIAC